MITPYYLDYNQIGILGIVGKSGSGKTSTTRFLLSQLVLDGFGLLIADPHGNSGKENLTVTTEPLHAALVRPIAIEKLERVQLLRLLGMELNARLNGQKGKRLVFVMDETTRHFVECTKEETDEQARILMLLANEGRKVGIMGIMIAQNWKADYVGSRSVRSSITHVLFHNTSEDEVKLFANLPADMKRTIARLSRGQAFFYPECIKLAIPHVTQDDLYALDIRGREDTAFLRSLVLPSQASQEPRRETIASKPYGDIGTEETAPQNGSQFKKIVREILADIHSGVRKDKTIGRMFKIGKSDKRYKTASKLYDAVKEQYVRSNLPNK